MFQFIKDELEFDQIIWEYGDNENPNWIHISYVSDASNRNRCLRAIRKNGKTHYEVI